MPVSVTTSTSYRASNKVILLSRKASAVIGIILAIVALGIFCLGHWTDIDLRLEDFLYDEASASFPWRNAWLTLTFNHLILKTILTLLGATVIAAALADLIWPQRRFDLLGRRLRLRIIASSAVMVPLLISLLKQSSNAHCPWDLARYGGTEPYLRLFDALPQGVLPGHCLPAGHASSALWLVAITVWWLPASPRKAGAAATAALTLGLASGWMQQMRGAHFMTHTFWSVWLACAIVFGLVLLFQRQPRIGRQAGAASQSIPS